MSEDVILFSRNLMFVRKLIGVTQSGLAEKLDVKPNTISNYEKEVFNRNVTGYAGTVGNPVCCRLF